MNKILVGYGPNNHVRLAFDEIDGLRSLGYNCLPIIYGRNNQLISNLNKLVGVIINGFKIVLALYKFSPDLIYLNSRFEPVASTRDFISLLIFKLFYFRRPKIVIKTHGSDLFFLLDQSFFLKRIVLPFLIKNVDKWLFLSEEEIGFIKLHNKKLGDRLVVTSNVIDPTRAIPSLEFRKRYNMDSDKFIFLFVGRIVNEKGVFSILKSIPYLDFKDRCLFFFVGDGPDLIELKKLTKEMGLDKYVRFTGFIQDAECDNFYANADVLIFPTFYTEGFPMVLFKSVVAGLPIITTKIRAAKDHLSSPENVLWVNGESEGSVAKAIIEIFKNDFLRNKMSQNNKLLSTKFSKDNVCLEMSKIFSSIKIKNEIKLYATK